MLSASFFGGDGGDGFPPPFPATDAAEGEEPAADAEGEFVEEPADESELLELEAGQAPAAEDGAAPLDEPKYPRRRVDFRFGETCPRASFHLHPFMRTTTE